MRNGRVFIDRFSAGLDEMPKKDQGSIYEVLKRLAQMTRFSTFEASENNRIAKTITNIVQRGYIECTGGSYPWTEFKLTEAGLKIINTGVS